MIKRLEQGGHRRPRVDWPSEDAPDGEQLFAGRKPLRKIIVLVDDDLLEEPSQSGLTSSGPLSQRVLLSGLLEHDLVQLFRFADDGPPPRAKRVETPFGGSVYPGWAVLNSPDPVHGSWGVNFSEDGVSFVQAGVIGNAPDVAANDDTTDAYANLTPDAAQERRRRDALAAQVASQGVNADLYVTARPYLHAATWNVAQGVSVCRPEDALPLLSLYLRSQGEFLVAPRFRFNRGLFFWVGTRELLPDAWRWFTACVQHSTGSGDDELTLLGGSLLQRVDRALEARDRVLVALNQKQNNDLRDDALAHLDMVLILLMGAFDVAARVAHRALSLPSAAEYRAGWQDLKKGGWVDKVRASAPNLADLVDAGEPGQQALTILRLLRNCVHGAALQGIAVVQGGGPQDTLVGIPSKDEPELLAAMDALGGRARWGVKPLLPLRNHVDPGLLVEQLFESTIPLLNRVMVETPVERLAHVSLSQADQQPPQTTAPEGRTDPFAPWIRQSIRWQLGL